MKKRYLLSVGIVVIIAMATMSDYGQSALTLPHLPSGNTTISCTQAYENGLAIIDQGSNDQLRKALDQEKPASEIVDDVFESLHDQECWAMYLCDSVAYSTNTTQPLLDEKLDNDQVPTRVGCSDIEDIKLPEQWGVLWGATIADINLVVEDPSGMTFIPACYEETRLDGLQSFSQAVDLRNDCEAKVAAMFDDPNTGSSYIKAMNALEKRSAEQTSQAVARKLEQLITRMGTMEGRMNVMHNMLSTIDQRLPCYLSRCD